MDVNLMMDNDSGYISHYHESNLDSSSEEVNQVIRSPVPVYFSEDALHEKPLIITSQPELNQFDDSYDLVLNSAESVKTHFSGFDESVISMDASNDANTSFVIVETEPIVWRPPESSMTSSADDNKENIRPTTPNKYENPQNSCISPDLFSDEDVEPQVSAKSNSASKNIKQCENSADLKLLKNVQSGLSGVCPPPNITIIQMSVTEMLSKIKENKSYFWDGKEEIVSNSSTKSSLIIDSFDSTKADFPEILQARYHGLHYNRSKVSEEFEHLCSKFSERVVGAETSSSCTVFDTSKLSPLKRKFSKPKWSAKSPGRRLSHLARRRITFSSSNLQNSSSSSILGSRARQILVDAKKLNSLSKKSPRKTPSKSPFKLRKNTPSSSAKKKLALRFRQMSGELENIAPSTSSSSSGSSIPSVKRTLFKSPRDERKSNILSGFPIERKSTKRALFSSPQKSSPPKKSSPFKLNLFDRKRKRTDFEESNSSKIAKTCPSTSENPRSKLEELSDAHKKKLQWAVYEALRLQNITATHPQYKVFASVLARVTRKFLPIARIEGRTTDKMFRIARYHSYAVVKGKTVDEIVGEHVKNRAKAAKPQGYIGIEDFNNLKNKESNKENVLQDKANIIESIEKRREQTGSKPKFVSESRIDRIRKVISFDENGH